MPLSILPNELLLSIAEELSNASLNNLTRTSHRLYFLLIPTLLHRLTLDYTADEVLCWAITANNVPTVNLALSFGECDPHCDLFTAPSCSCISLAVSLDRVEITELLIAHFGDWITSFNIWPCHHIPLYYAILRDDIALVALLLEHSADPNNTGHGYEISSSCEYTDPLIMAAANGSVEIVELLIKAGADANPHSRVMQEAMYTACDGKNWPYAKKLVQAGVVISLWWWKHWPEVTSEMVSTWLEQAQKGDEVPENFTVSGTSLE